MSASTSKNLRLGVAIIVSAAAILWTIRLLRNVDVQSLKLAAGRASLPYLVVGLSGTALVYFIRMLRLRFLARRLGADIVPAATWIDLYLKSTALGAITPLRSGDFSRIELLRVCGLQLSDRTKLVIADKLCDLLYLPLALCVCLEPLERVFDISSGVSLLTAAIAGASILIAIVLLRGRISLREVAMAIVITVFTFVVFCVANIALFRSAGIALAPLETLTVVTLTGILSSLPISFNGVGVRELSLLNLLSKLGVSTSSITIVIALEFAVAILFPLALLLAWQFIHLSARRSADPP